MEYNPANIVITIPERGLRWTADEAQAWAREVLAGGPPGKPINVNTNNEINWADVKKNVGLKVRIIARPKGLILTFNNGTKKYIAGDTATSNKTQSGLKSISTSLMQEKSKLEEKIRAFSKAEVQRYNKNICGEIRKQKITTTSEFWESGKRIRQFLDDNRDVSLEKITQALEQWGRGQYGYGKRIFDYAVFFYDWKKSLNPDDPIFSLSETRIMNIILASKDPTKRDRLVSACMNGPFKQFSDSQFKWVTGQSSRNFPDKKLGLFEKLNNYGNKVMDSDNFSKEEMDEMNTILKSLQSHDKVGHHRLPNRLS